MKKSASSLVALSLLLLASCVSPAVTHHREYFPGTNPELPYSAAVRVGNTVYVSGHLGIDPETGRAPADVKKEISIMLDRFAATLARTGLTMDHMVQMQVHCSDVALYGTFNDIYRKRFDKDYPTRAFLGSGTLLRGCHFEIIGIAAD